MPSRRFTPPKIAFFVLCAASLAAVTYALWFHVEDGRGFVNLIYYTIISNVYISVFPHEPVLIHYGKIYGPGSVAVAATFGAFLSGAIDYETLNPLLHVKKVRGLYAERKLYKKAVDWYYKLPFWTIVAAALTPIPFYPVKFLAISSNYPERKYLTALVVGRLPRYFLYAWLGDLLNVPTWVIIAAFIGMFLLGFSGKVWEKWSKHKERRASPTTVSTETTPPEQAPVHKS